MSRTYNMIVGPILGIPSMIRDSYEFPEDDLQQLQRDLTQCKEAVLDEIQRRRLIVLLSPPRRRSSPGDAA